jgi:hypothetical protein
VTHEERAAWVDFHRRRLARFCRVAATSRRLGDGFGHRLAVAAVVSAYGALVELGARAEAREVVQQVSR